MKNPFRADKLEINTIEDFEKLGDFFGLKRYRPTEQAYKEFTKQKAYFQRLQSLAQRGGYTITETDGLGITLYKEPLENEGFSFYRSGVIQGEIFKPNAHPVIKDLFNEIIEEAEKNSEFTAFETFIRNEADLALDSLDEAGIMSEYSTNAISHFFKEKGYDGIVYNDFQVSVFDSNQIKHIDNKGAFLKPNGEVSPRKSKNAKHRYFNEGSDNIYYKIKGERDRIPQQLPKTLDTQTKQKEVLTTLKNNAVDMPTSLTIPEFKEQIHTFDNIENFLKHLDSRDDGNARKAFLNLIEPTLQEWNVKLISGEKQRLIKSFTYEMQGKKEIFSIVATSKDNKTIYTFIPTKKEHYIKMLVKNADEIQVRQEAIKDSTLSLGQQALTHEGIIAQNDNNNLTLAQEIFNQFNTNARQNELFDRVFKEAQRLNVKFETSLSKDAPSNAVGEFDTALNTARVKNNKPETILHELIHSVTHKALSNPQELNQIQKRAFNEINSVFNTLKNDKRFNKEYALTSIGELLAELSNKSFIDKLKKVKIDNSSAFVKIIKAIAGFFNIDFDKSADKVLVHNLYKLIEGNAKATHTL